MSDIRFRTPYINTHTLRMEYGVWGYVEHLIGISWPTPEWFGCAYVGMLYAHIQYMSMYVYIQYIYVLSTARVKLRGSVFGW
jgi:hypothetical protein